MQELQRLEAKQAELNHQVAAKETDLDRLESRLENRKKQIETIERTTIPPLERNIKDLDDDIKRLQDELGTELHQTLTAEDRERLSVLKVLQESLVSKVEAQQEILDTAGLAKQKLQSLLENNLLKRRRELTEGVADEGNNNRRGSRGRLSTAAVQTQRKEDLEERQRERDEAARAIEDLEARLGEARTTEAELRKELLVAKNELEQLRGRDLQNVRALEDAQDKAERVLTKVSGPLPTNRDQFTDESSNPCSLYVA
jgi:chromosome segregation ATPase